MSTRNRTVALINQLARVAHTSRRLLSGCMRLFGARGAQTCRRTARLRHPCYPLFPFTRTSNPFPEVKYQEHRKRAPRSSRARGLGPASLSGRAGPESQRGLNVGRTSFQAKIQIRRMATTAFPWRRHALGYWQTWLQPDSDRSHNAHKTLQSIGNWMRNRR